MNVFLGLNPSAIMSWAIKNGYWGSSKKLKETLSLCNLIKRNLCLVPFPLVIYIYKQERFTFLKLFAFPFILTETKLALLFYFHLRNLNDQLHHVTTHDCLLWLLPRCGHMSSYLNVLPAQSLALLHLEVLPHELLVVRQLDDQRHVENLLHNYICKVNLI